MYFILDQNILNQISNKTFLQSRDKIQTFRNANAIIYNDIV